MLSPNPRNSAAWLLPMALTLLVGCRGPEPSCTRRYLREVSYPIDVSSDSLASPGSFNRDFVDQDQNPVPSQNQPELNESGMPASGEPFAMPRDLPGADVPPLQLPPLQPGVTAQQRREAIGKVYAPLPTLAPGTAWQQDPNGPLTLESLQMTALQNNPVIREAAADVEAARGQAIQAGLYPNPNMGYEADTVNTANTNGYHGAYFEQTVITAGKLRLARSAASMDVASATLNLRKTRIDVASQVRSFYFAAIVAREQLKLARALSTFTEQLYQVQIDLVEGGEAAPYEPLQLRVLALQARAAVAQSEQQYLSAWRQLAAALGVPAMKPTELAGRPDMPVPKINYESALAYMLASNTNLAVARNDVVQADYLLRLAKVTPVPDVDVGFALQRDYTFDPGTTTYNLTLGGEIPVFNKNRGNILTAQADLYRAQQAVVQVRNDLSGQLGEAFARYEAARVLAESFRGEALRDQVRTYRGVYERYRNDPQGIEFNDIVVAQQTLAVTLRQYIDVLGEQWQAVVDVAELLQVDDIFLMGEMAEVASIPDLGATNAEEIPVTDAPK